MIYTRRGTSQSLSCSQHLAQKVIADGRDELRTLLRVALNHLEEIVQLIDRHADIPAWRAAHRQAFERVMREE